LFTENATGEEKKPMPIRVIPEGVATTVDKVDRGVVREQIKDSVVASARDMVSGMVEAAKKGQVAPAKFLFELAGLFPESPEAANREEEESLTATLLRRLGLPTEPGKEGECGRESESDADLERPLDKSLYGREWTGGRDTIE